MQIIIHGADEKMQTLTVAPRQVFEIEVRDESGQPAKLIDLVSSGSSASFILPGEAERKRVVSLIESFLEWSKTHTGTLEDFARSLLGGPSAPPPTPVPTTKALAGPGIFIWQIENIFGGDINRIAEEVARLGFRRVNIKIAHAHLAFGKHPKTGVDQVPLAIKAFRDRGLSVWGWHYIYGERPEQEAQIGISRALALGVDGYTINAEVEFKAGPWMVDIAKRYLAELGKGIGNIPVGLSSFRFPTYHPQFPWKAFLDSGVVTLIQPQVYWALAHNPAEQLRRSLKENRALNNKLPIIPTGSVYSEGDWAGPTAQEIAEFNTAALAEKLPAIDWYAMHELVQEQGQTKGWLAEIKKQNARWA